MFWRFKVFGVVTLIAALTACGTGVDETAVEEQHIGELTDELSARDVCRPPDVPNVNPNPCAGTRTITHTFVAGEPFQNIRYTLYYLDPANAGPFCSYGFDIGTKQLVKATCCNIQQSLSHFAKADACGVVTISMTVDACFLEHSVNWSVEADDIIYLPPGEGRT